MSLWDEVVAAYGRPGVKAACLELQDRHGQCVSYLLWAAWTARAGRFPGLSDLHDCARLSRAWEEETLRPVRHRLRTAPDESERARFAAEALEDEARLLAALEERTPMVGRDVDVASGLDAAVCAWDRPAPADLLSVVSAAFPEA